MAAPAVKSQGTVFSISETNAAGDPIVIEGVVSVSDVDSGQASEIDTTVLSSTAKEYMMGLMDSGSFTMALRFNLDDPGQAEMMLARMDSNPRTFVMTLNATNPTLADNEFTATVYVTQFGVGEVATDNYVTGSATFRVTGLGVWA